MIDATAVISNNLVLTNTCSQLICLGGGMALYSSNATVSGNTFSHNTADWGGGGLYLGWNRPAIHDTVFISNSALQGGRAFMTGSAPTFSGNTVTSSTADIGGGLVTEGGKQVFINNVIAGNHASSAGGGLWSNGSSPRMLHNTIAHNGSGDGSGVYVTQSGFAGLRSIVALTNTILVSHAVGISVTGGNTVTADAVLWHDTPITVSQSPAAVVTVQNQHTGDPAFAPDGYHLTMVSAAIDRGWEAGITTDIDGDPRPAPTGTQPDLGADEISQQRVGRSLGSPHRRTARGHPRGAIG